MRFTRATTKRDRVNALLESGEAAWCPVVRLLADRARAAGVTVPLADLLIFACAKTHALEVAHDDTHFDDLKKLA